MNKKLFAKRSFKYGAASTALVAIFVAGLVLINIIFSVLGQKVTLKFDITPEKIYEISNDTKDYLKKLDKNVTITIMVPEAKFDANALEILKKYPKLSNKISFKDIDLNVNPGYAKKYNSTINYDSILVECGSKYKVISDSDLYQIDSSNSDGSSSQQQQITGIKAEQQITSAIMYVTSDKTQKLLTTTGHEETVGSGLKDLSTSNNYDLEEINLVEKDISDDTKMIAIVDPQRDFTVEEIDKLDRYTDRGDVGIMIFLSPTVKDLPNLQNYMAEWGLEPQKNIILDSENSIADPSQIILQSGDSDYTKNLSSKLMTLIQGSSSIKRLFTEKGSFATEDVLTSYSSSFAKTGDLSKINSNTKESGDQAGPFTLVAASQKMITGTSTAKNSRLVVFGSPSFVSDSAIQTSIYSNSELILGIINSVRDSKDLFVSTPKYFENTSMSITAIEFVVYTFIFVIVIPLALLAAAIVIFMRRKNL
ncbi:MAG: Gldg family protein [Bacillota bacterium]|nr:Gldg family protein [Bacillota bacterium]